MKTSPKSIVVFLVAMSLSIGLIVKVIVQHKEIQKQERILEFHEHQVGFWKFVATNKDSRVVEVTDFTRGAVSRQTSDAGGAGGSGIGEIIKRSPGECWCAPRTNWITQGDITTNKTIPFLP